MVGRVLYTTAGMRRAAIALNAATGEMLWMHAEDEGRRGDNAIRNGAGRGLAYWASADGADRRIIYVTPGYRLMALDAKTGMPIPAFGSNGAVDLKLEDDQEVDLDTGELGLNATPLVVGDVIVVGAAHRPGIRAAHDEEREGVRARLRRPHRASGSGSSTPSRRQGEFGYDTWLEGSAEYNGNTGAWAQMSADPELGLSTCRPKWPTGDYYGGHRPGNTLFADSIVALDVKTGQRKWHYQTVHHDVWDWDLPCAPMLFDLRVNGRTVKALAQPTKSAFLFVLNRETGEPIWPIEERPVPQSDVPKEQSSPTQPFPTQAGAVRSAGRHRERPARPDARAQGGGARGGEALQDGPDLHAAVASRLDGPLATLQLPSEVGGANWPGGSMDPETNYLYIHSHTTLVRQRARARQPGAVRHGVRRRAGASCGPGTAGGRRGRPVGADAPGRRRRGGATVQGLPLIKPPYDRITAYDMNTGDIVWQKTHSSTPDDIKNHPALKGLNLPRLGQPGRTFIGVLTTKNLVIAGEGGVHTNEAGKRVALLRAYDKRTGEDAGAVEMPAKQTGSPMSYQINGKQYIVLAVSGNDGAEILAYALP